MQACLNFFQGDVIEPLIASCNRWLTDGKSDEDDTKASQISNMEQVALELELEQHKEL